MATERKYKTDEENYNDCVRDAQVMTIPALQETLRLRQALHGWAVRAYEKVLAEKQATEKEK